MRLVSATNRNLLADVKTGRFREDLFYRLHVFPLAVPPLRDRPEDIPDLVRHFLARFAAEEGKRIRLVGSETLALLRAYRWPGNVRQLENAIFRAVVLAESDELNVTEFPQIAAQLSNYETADPTPMAVEPLVLLAPIAPQAGDLAHPGGQPAGMPAPATSGGLPLLDAEGEVRPLEELESAVIRFAISHYRGQMSEVARRLQIGRSTLYRKLENLGIQEHNGADRDSGSSPPVAAR